MPFFYGIIAMHMMDIFPCFSNPSFSFFYLHINSLPFFHFLSFIPLCLPPFCSILPVPVSHPLAVCLSATFCCLLPSSLSPSSTALCLSFTAVLALLMIVLNLGYALKLLYGNIVFQCIYIIYKKFMAALFHIPYSSCMCILFMCPPFEWVAFSQSVRRFLWRE